LNREDVDIILHSLQHYLANTEFKHSSNQIFSLKKRLLAKVSDSEVLYEDTNIQ